MAKSPSSVIKGSGRTITFDDTSDWGAGFIGAVTIANTATTAVNGWTIEFDLASNITNIWNAQIISHVGNHYVIGNLSYDALIPAGGAVSFGFQAAAGGVALPTTATLNGVAIAGGTTPPPPPPSITIADSTVTETGVATLNETFTVTLSAASTTPVTVHYATANGTAHAGADYNAASGSITFAPGQTTQTVTIVTHPGATGTEAFSLTLSSPTGATIARATATGSIVNPAPVPPVLPTISVANVTVNETGTPSGGSLLPAGYLSTSGNQIVDAAGHAVKISAVNWFGFETSNFAPHGLWSQGYQSMMNQMVQLGFNAIRLPFSLQLFASGSVSNGIDYSKNPDLKGLTGLQIMDKIVDYAGKIGMKIILDDHRSAAGSGPNGDGLWYDGGYTEAQWIATWKMLAGHYAGNSTIIAADLLNEPHGSATWGDGGANDWAAAATRAGDAIQAVNPNWLIMVEGIEQYQGSSTWWGGNLMGVKDHPVSLTIGNKLVYSPHDYPASVYPQTWFSAANYPNNLPAVWDKYWGYIYENGTAPVLVGEFGSKLATASDQAWMAKLIDYMNHPGGVGGAQGISWAYWDWNPNSSDTGGILKDDWVTVDQTKMAAITPGLYQSGTATTTTAPTEVDFTVTLSAASGTPVTVHYATVDGTAKAGVDYVATAGDLTFAAGETTKIVAAHLLSHPGASGQMQFLLSLSAPSGGTLAGTSATATLVYGNTSAGGGTTGGGTTGGGTTGGGTTSDPTVPVALHVDNDWGSGLTATTTVTNTASSAASGWKVEIDTADVITNVWNGVILSHTGNAYVIGNASYNGSLAAHASTSFGFQATEASAGAAISAHLLAMPA